MSGWWSGQRAFGFDLSELESSSSTTLIRYLERAWAIEHGAEPLDLQEDLERLRPIFQSHVTGSRVRDHIKTLPRIPLARPFIPHTLFIAVDSDRGIVTPEGRAVIELVRSEMSGRRSDLAEVAQEVAEFYGESLRSWIGKAVETGLVPLPSAGFAVFLLVNGSVGEMNAMRFPNLKDEELDLAAIVMNVASAFSTGVQGPPIQEKEKTQLRTSWVISQAVRHLGGNLTRGSGSNGGVASIWVEEGRVNAVLTEIVGAVRAREKATRADLERAFNDALKAYESGRVLLGAWGISHERRRSTEELRTQLLAAFDRVRQ